MRIRFLTATIEPGKDGIGDYTMRLAEKCRGHGHTIDIVAFNDRHARETEHTPELLRLPCTTPWPDRLRQFEQWQKSAPDWTSLQFAPYALHKKGLVGGWINRLSALITHPLHLFAHEIWIGQDAGDPFRHKLVGLIQRAYIKSLFRALAPQVLHTSNAFYAECLGREGFAARVLPLLGSVPFERGDSGEAERKLLRQLGLGSRSEAWLFGIFGTLHPVWPPEPLLSRLIEAGAQNHRRICLLSLGRIGSGQPLWDRMKKEYAGRIHFLQLGELRVRELSAIFQALDFGIATTPYEILGKSSAVAVMREHGLPIIVNRISEPPPESLPPDIITPRSLRRLKAEKHGAPADPDVVVDQFLSSIGNRTHQPA